MRCVHHGPKPFGEARGTHLHIAPFRGLACSAQQGALDWALSDSSSGEPHKGHLYAPKSTPCPASVVQCSSCTQQLRPGHAEAQQPRSPVASRCQTEPGPAPGSCSTAAERRRRLQPAPSWGHGLGGRNHGSSREATLWRDLLPTPAYTDKTSSPKLFLGGSQPQPPFVPPPLVEEQRCDASRAGDKGAAQRGTQPGTKLRTREKVPQSPGVRARGLTPAGEQEEAQQLTASAASLGLQQLTWARFKGFLCLPCKPCWEQSLQPCL